MKNNLTQIQPLEYNNLFSSYHNKSKENKIINYNLPKITKLFPYKQFKDQSTNTFFNQSMKLKLKPINNVKNISINKNKKLKYPILNTSVNTYYNNETNIKNNTNYTLYHLYKINHQKLGYKKNKEKMNNSQNLNIIYLNLFKTSLENKKDFLNLDMFYKDIDDFKINNNIKSEMLSKKLNEINNKSIMKIKNIFYETDFNNRKIIN